MLAERSSEGQQLASFIILGYDKTLVDVDMA